MDNEQPHQELVKCVVVGDTAVGKTRLICTRTCDRAPMTLAQLLTTHVPTVWAIDQYRMCKEVLERSIHCVDNVSVSLRLWDTFGDHEKDRRFAYGRSDVVLLCFSIASRVSLRNCRLRWFEEIRKFCPNTPVILVGCKNDLRFVIEDKSYLHIYKERSPFVRLIKKSELVLPDEARQLANDFGIYYYETSVLTGYGLDDVFENAIRIALIARRQQRFWITNLKRIDWPRLQQPFTPPKRKLPIIDIDESRYEFHLQQLLETEMFTDVRIVYTDTDAASNGQLLVHRFMLAAASKLFQRLFAATSNQSTASNTNLTRSSSESSLVSNLDEDFNCDDFLAVRKSFSKTMSSFKFWDQLKRHASHQLLNVFETRPLRDFSSNGPSYGHRQLLHVTNHFDTMTSTTTTTNHLTIQLNASVNWPIFKQCIRFIYTGEIDCGNEYNRSEILKIAELFEFDLLANYLKKINDRQTLRRIQRQQLLKFCKQNQFTDIVFKLDDSICSAHKALLVARCDVLSAMFRGNFRESQAKIVLFPGVSESTFRILINYLYLDEIPKLTTNGCLALIELANRFCLPRLLNLIEFRLVEELERQAHVHDDDNNNLLDVLQKCFQLLEPVKFHNAFQLSDWCLNFLCLNYNNVCKNLAKYLRQLNDENRKYLVENRYPPIWYLKDCDFYERKMAEQRSLIKEKRRLTADKSKYGCLCFAKTKALSKNVLGTPTTTVTPITNNVPLRCP